MSERFRTRYPGVWGMGLVTTYLQKPQVDNSQSLLGGRNQNMGIGGPGAVKAEFAL